MKVYEIVVERIKNKIEAEIERINRGDKPSLFFRYGWSNCFAYSAVTMKEYSYLNQLLCGISGGCLTVKEAFKYHAKLRKNHNDSGMIVWCGRTPLKDKDGNPVLDEEGNVKTKPTWRYSLVYSWKDFEGLPSDLVKKLEEYEASQDPTAIEVSEDDDIDQDFDEEAEEVIEDYISRAKLIVNRDELSSSAYYSPSDHSVTVPCNEQFRHMDAYYGTLFHELAHSTGHTSLLNRSFGKFGDTSYAKEELIAEITSSACLNKLNMDTESNLDNSSAYCLSWLGKLKNDPKMLIEACPHVDKALNLIFNET